MPGGVGGFVLARRRNDLRPGIPVIYMSGYASITRESMDGVPAPTLRKPCSPAAPSAASSRRGDGRGYAVPAGRGSFRHAPGSHRPVCCR
ncbi:hypothetical protein, partial [Salipiger sp. HF18]|uniref:hypothetical protein n=1 Tax=Salipiger sp. HF18 TaxID=2721557 RepID=UPI001C379610